MKKNLHPLYAVLLCCVCLLASNYSWGQSTSLNYKTKGKSIYGVDIVFADENGSISLQPTVYFNYSNIYFVLSPTPDSPKDVFKEDNVNEILTKITIDQNEKTVKQSKVPKFLFTDKNKISQVIIAFPKNGFENFNSFSFSVNEFLSEKISLKEEFFQSFVPQNTVYEQSLLKLKENDFLGAYASFIKIVDAANETPEIKTFSFYGPAVITNIPQTINLFIQSEIENFNIANAAFQEEKTITALKTCEAIVESVSKNIEVFNSYLSMEGVNVTDSRKQISSFLNSLTEQTQENTAVFEQEKMLFFKQANYQDYKFSLFIDLISKMLLYKSSLTSIDKLEPIDIALLKNFPESKRELMGDWEDQFKVYIDLINNNIEFNGLVFKDEVMDNLEDLIDFQKQPYYEIISAFNVLNEDTEDFRDYLFAGLKKCSDAMIIDNIEYWLLSFRLTDEGINSAYITELNEGIKLIQKEEYDRADDIFNLLMRIANQYAPVWYYSGLIKYHLGESYSAERFFKKALEIYPEYMAPRKFILKIFETDESYSQLFENTNKALKTMNAWVFHFKRATAFYQLKKYDEAIIEITDECLKLNRWDTKQYFLLGDAYLALNNFEKAKEAYEKTIDINPFSSESKNFDNRMKVVYKKMEEAEKNKVLVIEVSSEEMADDNKEEIK